MGFPFRLITNETLKPKSTIRNTLQMLGYKVNEQDMQCPVPFLKEILIRENLRPHLLLHPRVWPFKIMYNSYDMTAKKEFF